MTQKIVHRMVLTAAALAMSAVMGTVSAAEVETATFNVHNNDGSQSVLVVVTEDDGSFSVYADGVKLTGDAAAAILTQHEIQITVNSIGHIVKNTVSKSVEVVVPPKAVAEVDVSAPAAEAPVVSLPSNSMAGSGIADVGASHGVGGDALDVAPVIPDSTVSK